MLGLRKVKVPLDVGFGLAKPFVDRFPIRLSRLYNFQFAFPIIGKYPEAGGEFILQAINGNADVNGGSAVFGSFPSL